MKKTSLYLEPELDLALARRAAVVGVTKAELIRQALRNAVGDSAQPRLTAIGVGSGPGWVSSDTDRALAESGFGE
ncbi:CopG family transcriptional regulator [Gaiella sp.]|uniref:ribbon-helix-helix domain-containing protein n=1 Tax=Gaiella sp. TaxID=2663207 RepID=UPI0032648F2F